MRYKARWSKYEINIAVAMHREGRDAKEIGARLNRTPYAVRGALQAAGEHGNKRPVWSEAETAMANRLRSQGHPIDEIAHRLGRSSSAVHRHMNTHKPLPTKAASSMITVKCRNPECTRSFRTKPGPNRRRYCQHCNSISLTPFDMPVSIQF